MTAQERWKKFWKSLGEVDYQSGLQAAYEWLDDVVTGPLQNLTEWTYGTLWGRFVQLIDVNSDTKTRFASLFIVIGLSLLSLALLIPAITCLAIMLCAPFVWATIYFPTRVFMNFCLHDSPGLKNYTPSAQLSHSDNPYRALKDSTNRRSCSWGKVLRRAISWLFMGALVGATVFAGLYFGGAPLLILSSGFYAAMAGASAAAYVGLMMYTDALRDTPNNSHTSRFFYYLRMVTASCLMVPLMVLGAKLLAPLYGVAKSFTVAEGLFGSTKVHFMLKSLMGIACGIMFVGQSLSMMLVALSHRAARKGWTVFTPKRLCIAGKSLSVLCTLGLAGIATNVIPLVKGAWTAAIAGGVQVWHAVAMGVGLLSAALLGFWRYAVLQNRQHQPEQGTKQPAGRKNDETNVGSTALVMDKIDRDTQTQLPTRQQDRTGEQQTEDKSQPSIPERTNSDEQPNTHESPLTKATEHAGDQLFGSQKQCKDTSEGTEQHTQAANSALNTAFTNSSDSG